MNLWRRILQERRRVIVPLAVLLVANIAVLLLAVLPLQQSVTRAQDQLTASQHNLALAQVALVNVKNQKSSKEQAENELKKFYGEVLPPDLQGAEELTNFGVSDIARQFGVTLRRSTHDWEYASKDSRLVRVTGRTVLEGDYQAIRRFLHAMEAARKFLVIEKVELSQSSAGDRVGGPPPGSRLEITIETSTYYMAEGPRGGKG